MTAPHLRLSISVWNRACHWSSSASIVRKAIIEWTLAKWLRFVQTYSDCPKCLRYDFTVVASSLRIVVPEAFERYNRLSFRFRSGRYRNHGERKVIRDNDRRPLKMIWVAFYNVYDSMIFAVTNFVTSTLHNPSVASPPTTKIPYVTQFQHHITKRIRHIHISSLSFIISFDHFFELQLLAFRMLRFVLEHEIFRLTGFHFDCPFEIVLVVQMHGSTRMRLRLNRFDLESSTSARFSFTSIIRSSNCDASSL